MKKIYYYSTYEDDIIKSSNQDYKLKDNSKNTMFYISISLIVIYIFILLILK